MLSVLVTQAHQLEPVLACTAVSEVMLEADAVSPEQWESTASRIHAAGKTAVLGLPRMFRENEKGYGEAHRAFLSASCFDAFLARDPEGLFALREAQPEAEIIADASLYAWNSGAAAFWRRYADRLTLPHENDARSHAEAGLYGCDLVVYGRTPLMVSAGCLKKTLGKCNHKTEWLTMKDRKGYRMPVLTFCTFCYNVVYNAVPTSLFTETARVRSLRPAAVRLQFSDENVQAVSQVLAAAEDFLADLAPHAGGEDAETRTPGAKLPQGQYTRGRFVQGVE
ncbi:MAG: U32 family peptidase [Lachnospiraceae bacterium]|nr:U32 family peptidase [Lachnospiraceae bacterium]